MQPFWMMRRLAEQGLRNENEKKKSSQKLKFNVTLIEEDFQNMCIGTWKNEPVSMVYKVTVPVLTNSCALKAGDELILRKSEVKTLPREKYDDWRTDMRTRDKKVEANIKADAKAKGKANAKATASNRDDVITI